MFNNQIQNKMKKLMLFATISAFAVSTMFAQQSTGTKSESKPKTTAAPAPAMKDKKDTTKKDEKKPVKKVPAKKTAATTEKKKEEPKVKATDVLKGLLGF
ncbi:MAG: hypothetical protein HYR68_01360 [Burkholderiales bacterium]|nr:hypothetical protein [Burkholderiales bacterium]